MAKGGRGGRGARSGGHSKHHHSSHSHSFGSRGHIGSHFGHHHHHHHHGVHHRYRGTGRSMSNPGQVFQILIDAISAKTAGPTMANGVMTLEGSQISVINHLNSMANSQDTMMYQPQPQYYQSPGQSIQMANMAMQNQMGMQNQMYSPNPMNPMDQFMAAAPMMAPQMTSQSNVITQAHITVVGNKIATGNNCCFILTLILGSLLIFPLFLMCCGWWKKIVFPKYDLDLQFYRALGRFLRKEYQCRMLVLTVVDNGFDAQKARLLGQSLAGTALTGLTFVNAALDCNYQGSEADDFGVNMAQIKSLPFTSSLIWGDMIL